MPRLAPLVAACALLLSLAARAGAPPAPPTPPPIAARAYVLVDAQSGRTLAAEGEADPFEPASLTKLMTAYLAFQALREHRLDPAQAVKPSAAALAAPGERMFLDASHPATVDELLQGLAVDSANDAAIALAEAVGGSREGFVAQMNRAAARLGLADSHFANATGRPEAGHHASARDLAKLALALLAEYPARCALFAQREFRYHGIVQANRNKLLWIDPTVDGMQAGFTEASDYGIVVTARRGERRLVAVLLGVESEALRTSEAQKLLNFGFQAYQTRRLYRAGQPVATPAIYRGTRAEVRVGLAHDVWVTLPRGAFTGLGAVLETRQPFVAPLARGEKAGIMKITRDGAPLGEFPVVALDDVPVAGFLSRGWDTLRLMFGPTP